MVCPHDRRISSKRVRLREHTLKMKFGQSHEFNIGDSLRVTLILRLFILPQCTVVVV